MFRRGVENHYYFRRRTFAPVLPQLHVPSTPSDQPLPETVTPHRLCDECRVFCATLEHFTPPHRWIHYNSNLNISRGARAGCHLCSIILGRLRHTAEHPEIKDKPRWREDDHFAVDSIVDRPKPKHRFLRNNGYLILDLRWRADDGTMETLNQGSVYLEPSQGTIPTAIESDLSRWHTSLGADVCFQMVWKWLDRCLTQHEYCRASQHYRSPSRLLRLDAFPGSKDVRVGQNFCGPTVQYATLSWRWGANLATRLTRATTEEYGKRIPFSDLPKTFQDAVTVVRKLGLTHLWIDALCIVQDDEASLSKEISRMNEVYAGSTFTVALANAPETDAGFLGTRWPLSWQDCWLTEEGNVNIVAHADAGQQHSAMPGFCPLDKRGWVVQERLLSPRTIYYGKEHIFWDCRQTSDHEQQPFEGSNAYGGAQKEEDKKFNIREHDVLLDNGMTGKLKRCYSKLQMLDVDGRDLMWESILRTTWHLIVSAYTNSTLSLDQDKSRALAGAGALIQKKFSMKASFGLWHDFFLTDLLWFPLRAEGPHPDPELFDRAPSWSWMARNRAVYNPWIVDMASRAMFDGRYAYLIDAQLKAELITLPEPTEFSVALGQIHDFGPYATRLRGPLLKVKWGQDMTERPDEWRHDNGYFVTTDRKLALERESDHEHEHRNFRADYILPADLDLFCLLVTETRNEAKGMIDKQLGLILEKMDVPDRYRRVGALQHALSDRACEACALFPDDAPIAEVDII